MTPTPPRTDTAQGWSKGQRSTPAASGTTSGTITLAALDRNDHDITPTGDFALADFSDLASAVGQKGTITIDNSDGHALTGLGTAWKRVGVSGVPTLAAGWCEIDYRIVSATRIHYSYAEAEASSHAGSFTTSSRFGERVRGGGDR